MAKKKSKTNLLLLVIGALVSCALWGSAFPGIKIGYIILEISQSDVGARLLFAGIRFFLAGVLAILIGSIYHRKFLKPHKKSFWMIFHLALLQTVIQYFFFYMGLAYTTGIQGSIINSLSVFITLVLSVYIFKQEKMTSRKLIGCIAGFIGVILVVVFGSISANGVNIEALSTMNKGILIGDAAVLLSVISGAASSCKIKDYSKREEPFVLSGYQFMLGGLILAITGYCAGGRLKLSNLQNTYYGINGWQVLLHLAFVSAVAYSLWGILLKRFNVSQVTVFGFMTPVFGTIMSAYFLGESQSISIRVLKISLIMIALGTILCVYDGGVVSSKTSRKTKR